MSQPREYLSNLRGWLSKQKKKNEWSKLSSRSHVAYVEVKSRNHVGLKCGRAGAVALDLAQCWLGGWAEKEEEEAGLLRG